MSNKTKAELLEMLAQAVRNTQPQPVNGSPAEPARDAHLERKRKSQSGKKRPTPQHTPNAKGREASDRRKQRSR
jgi:hypothetical protein